jgi:hypothetical protein
MANIGKIAATGIQADCKQERPDPDAGPAEAWGLLARPDTGSSRSNDDHHSIEQCGAAREPRWRLREFCFGMLQPAEARHSPLVRAGAGRHMSKVLILVTIQVIISAS